MRILYGAMGQAQKRVFDAPDDVVRIGSDPQVNHIVLRNPHVAARHAVFSRNGAHWELRNLGEADIYIGAQRLGPGEGEASGHAESPRPRAAPRSRTPAENCWRPAGSEAW